MVGARARKGGILQLFTAQAQDKQNLETQRAWTTKIGKTARVSQQQFTVLVHSVPKGFKVEEDLQRLQGQNQATCPGLRISKATWLKRKADPGKTASSLIIWVNTAEQANRVLDRGLFWECENLMTEIFHSSHRVLQCFKCQQYGHIAAKCTKTTDTCSHCAQGHQVKDCVAPKQNARCACCGRAHPAWSTDCPVRIKERTRARDARVNTPPRYRTGQEPQPEVITRPNTNNKRTRTGGSPVPPPYPRPGRPRGIEVAGRDSTQTRLNIGPTTGGTSIGPQITQTIQEQDQEPSATQDSQMDLEE